MKRVVRKRRPARAGRPSVAHDANSRIADFESFDLNLLPVFLAIMREGSLTAAGRVLGKKAPAMSQLLANLRRALGDNLFDSAGHSMVPTRRALELEPVVRELLDKLRIEFTAYNSFDPRTSCRRFALDMPIGSEIVFGPLLVSHAAEHAPGVQFRIASEQARLLRSELRRGGTELAMIFDRLDDDELRQMPLYRDQIVVVSRRGHPAAGESGGITRNRFETNGHVAIGLPRNTSDCPVDGHLEPLGLKRAIRVYVPTVIAIPSTVESSDLLAVLTERVARQMQKRWAIDIHPLPIKVSPLGMNMVWHRRYDADPGHRWLRDVMVQLASRT